MRLICIGGSLTFGNVGYSYIHFLDKNITAVNKGKNGDTVRGVYTRLKRIVDDSKYDSPIFILGIGTNDILLPYLRSLSLFWCVQMSMRCKIMKCTEIDDLFNLEYYKILDLLAKKNKKVVIFGLPFINLKNFPNDILIKRNAIIKELAERFDFPFVDIYELQKRELAADPYTYTWKCSFLIRMIDAVIMTLFPFSKDLFSKSRGLTTSVDGVHFNSKSAYVFG